MTSRPNISYKRVYEPAAPDDGYRVLIDRMWPRGVSHERAALDEWARELAPSDDLRRWYGQCPSASTSSAGATAPSSPSTGPS